MTKITKGELPEHALLRRYRAADGCHTDCYFTDIKNEATLAQFVGAFYTTSLFRVERFILGALVARPSTDEDVRDLVEGRCEDFAAWRVEDRADDQLLMCDYQKRTRSWFMVARGLDNGTRLYFGSAVTPAASAVNTPGERPNLGPVFQALLGFHQVYSRALLGAAAARLKRAD
jgi:hypothetical protein